MLRSRLRSHHSFSGAHRVRPSNSRLVRLGSPARAMVPQRCALSHQILRSHHSFSGAHRVRPSNLWLARVLACVLATRVRLQASLRRPLWLARVLRCAPSAPVELVARTRVLRFQVSQINCDSKRVIAHPAFSPIAFGCKQACAVRSGSLAFASFSSESNQLRQQTGHRTSRPSASPTCCVLATRSPARTECARRTRGSPALARPLWLARVHLEFQSFPSIVSA